MTTVSTSPGAGPIAPRPGRRQLLRPATTPAELRLLLGGLVSLCLIWGAVAAWTVSLRASAAGDVVATSEPVSLDGQQIYRSLSDADATAATAFLSGAVEPLPALHRYQADIARSAARLEAATAVAGHSPAGAELATISADLPVYTGEVETARADNRLGLPLGAAYLREASGTARGTLLPAARGVYDQANSQLTADSGRATGLPTALLAVVPAVAAGYLLYRAQRYLFRRTNRVASAGLVVASAAGAVSLLWLAVALTVARVDLLQARGQGSAPVEALARADIAALRAHADESLTLVDASGDDSFQADFTRVQRQLGPGPGTLLTAAAAAASGSPAAGQAAAAGAAATDWYAVHRRVRSLDDTGQHLQAIRLAIGSAPADSGPRFERLDGALTSAILADQRVFAARAVAGRDATDGLEAGVIVAALVMAAGCARGVTRRLAEYR